MRKTDLAPLEKKEINNIYVTCLMRADVIAYKRAKRVECDIRVLHYWLLHAITYGKLWTDNWKEAQISGLLVCTNM